MESNIFKNVTEGQILFFVFQKIGCILTQTTGDYARTMNMLRQLDDFISNYYASAYYPDVISEKAMSNMKESAGALGFPPHDTQ